MNFSVSKVLGFLPGERTLSIEVKDASGTVRQIDLALNYEEQFIADVVSAVHKHHRSSGGGRAIVVDAIKFALRARGDGYAATFTFAALDAELSFFAPVSARSVTEIRSIQDHFDQALRKMGYSDKVNSN